MRMVLVWLLLAGTASAQSLPPSPQGLTAQFSSTCAASTCATWAVGVATSVTVSVTGAGSWTGTFKASSDNGNTYFDATMIRLSDRTNVTTVSDTGDGQYAIVNSGITHVQFRLTTWVSGGANVWAIRGYGSPMALPFGSPIPALASGTCVTPSYTFTGDTNSGIGWLGADNIAGCAGGATIFDWNASRVLSAVPLLFTDNTVDIGAAGATRPRTGYFGTSVVSPILQGAGTGTTVANVGANSCGTTAATIAGNQLSGVITVGSVAGTQCRVTFATAAPVARDCAVTDSTTTIATRATVVDTLNTDFLGAFVAGDQVTFICVVR